MTVYESQFGKEQYNGDRIRVTTLNTHLSLDTLLVDDVGSGQMPKEEPKNAGKREGTKNAEKSAEFEKRPAMSAQQF